MGMLLSGKCSPGKPKTPSSVARTEKKQQKKLFHMASYCFIIV